MKHFACLFPGQGSQSLNMMDGFADISVVQHTFAEASSVLGIDLWAMLQASSNDEINQTVNTQPLMLATGVATWRAWCAQGGTMPAYLAGHSLGEYSALVAAESLTFADALRLVHLRAQAMQDAVPAGQGAMAAILGLDDAGIVAACAEAALGDVVQAANFNSPGQVVIAGTHAAVERAMAMCKERGARRAMLLPVSVPSHCDLMKPAAARLASALAEVTLVAPKIPVLHNADVASYNDPAQIRDALVRQLYSPVRWTETVRALVTQGVNYAVECGPGKVLLGLNKRIDSTLESAAVVDSASLTATCATLA